jgi:glutathione synthase/RimK-type ligase-like ATP-grasp enzyme
LKWTFPRRHPAGRNGRSFFTRLVALRRDVATVPGSDTVRDMTRIAFLSMDSLEGFCCYDSLTSELLQQRGITVDLVSWRDSSARWSQYDLVVQRSSWDYQQSPDGYLAALAAIASSGTRLENSLALSRWNIRKTYLRDLEAAGCPVVPTVWVDSPTVRELHAAAAQLSVDEFVIKPVIGANADHIHRLRTDSPVVAFQAAESEYCGRTGLVQPYLHRIADAGEVSLIYFSGRFSHGVLKRPKSGDFRVQEEHGGRFEAFVPDDDLRALGERCLRWIPEPALYARVDIVRLADNQPAIIEVELLEPSLYLNCDAGAPDRFAQSIESLLRAPIDGQPRIRK